MVAALGNGEAHVFAARGRVTTPKARYVAATQQLLRARSGTRRALAELRADSVKIVADALPHHKAVVLFDSAEGVLAGGTATEIVAAARAADRIVVVDLVKGLADYRLDQVAGADIVQSYGRSVNARTLYGGDYHTRAARWSQTVHEGT